MYDVEQNNYIVEIEFDRVSPSSSTSPQPAVWCSRLLEDISHFGTGSRREEPTGFTKKRFLLSCTPSNANWSLLWHVTTIDDILKTLSGSSNFKRKDQCCGHEQNYKISENNSIQVEGNFFALLKRHNSLLIWLKGYKLCYPVAKSLLSIHGFRWSSQFLFRLPHKRMYTNFSTTNWKPHYIDKALCLVFTIIL